MKAAVTANVHRFHDRFSIFGTSRPAAHRVYEYRTSKLLIGVFIYYLFIYNRINSLFNRVKLKIGIESCVL